MSNTSKRLLSLVVALVMVLSLACTSAFAAGTDTYSMIDNFDITTLDYVYNNKSSNGDYTSNFIEGLLTQDPHGKLVGGMAFGLAMFVAGAWWPVLREMKPCYLATAAATIFFLVLGGILFKDTPEERKDVEDFVGRLSA